MQVPRTPCAEAQHHARNGLQCCLGVILQLKKAHPEVNFDELKRQIERISNAMRGCGK